MSNEMNIVNVLTEQLAMLIDNEQSELKVCVHIAGTQATEHTARYLETRYHIEYLTQTFTVAPMQSKLMLQLLKHAWDFIDWQELAEHYTRKALEEARFMRDSCPGKRDYYQSKLECIEQWLKGVAA